MAKNNDNKIWIFIIIALLVIILLKGGVFEKFIITEKIIGADQSDFDNTPIDPACTFDIDKSIACVGEDVTGTIRDGALKQCVVAYDYENTGWVVVSIEDLDINGVVTETRSAEIAGTYVWTALCGYFDGEIFIAECRTNDETIEIIDCDENGDEVPTYTCGWVGEQCEGTCPPTHPLCVDMWHESLIHPDYVFCACIDPDTETVHPDWKPGGVYHDDSGGDGLICFDDDVEQDLYFKGTCTPIGGIPEEDFCPTDTAVTQLWCSSDGTYCMGASYPCPDGEFCIDGACVVGELGDPDMGGCISTDGICLQMCQMFVSSDVDSAHCEIARWEDGQRVATCPEWSNSGWGLSCVFVDCPQYQQGDCCSGTPEYPSIYGCECVCEKWY